MIKYFCDICGRELNSKVVYKNSDPDDYTFGGIEINIGFRIMTIDDICNACAKKIQKLQKTKLWILLRKR